MILLPLVDGESDDEALERRIIFAEGGNDAHVGEAVLEVEAAQQVAISLQPVGIVDIAALEEAQEVGLTGMDHVLETEIRIGPVADELDLGDPGLGAFIDLENEVHPAVRELDDLRI